MALSKVSLIVLVSLMSLANWVPSSLAQSTVRDYLDAHNVARSRVRVGPMRWDNTLAAYALNYANSRRFNCRSLVSSRGPYGENIAAGPGLTGRQAVGMWVGERQFYNYGSNSCVGGFCRHYTQVVWRSSVRVGCARVRCTNGWWYVICSYAPRGNIPGQRPY